jgi:L-2-hydroxyglutarate oxidase LhgO
MGADLRYNKNVIAVDHENGIVELETGEKFYAKNIVVTCGALTDQFFQHKD